jgi:hypothetical protein
VEAARVSARRVHQLPARRRVVVQLERMDSNMNR